MAVSTTQRTPRPRDYTTEIGSTGTSVQAGQYLGEEHNAALTYDQIRGTLWAPSVWARMRREDPQVAAILTGVEQAVISSQLDLDVPECCGDEVAEYCWRALTDELTGGWVGHVRDAILHLQYGFYAFEKVWEYRDGRHWLARISPRPPRTVKEWRVDDAGRLTGLLQARPSTDGWGTDDIEIPAAKLLIYTHGGEGANVEGVSVLRPAYHWWRLKRTLAVAMGINAERFACGVPVFEAGQPGNAKDGPIPSALMTFFEETGEAWRNNERSWLAHPAGSKVQVLFPDMAAGGLVGYLGYCDGMIARVLLGQWLQLGDTEHGSRALGSTMMEPWDVAIEGHLDSIAQTFNGDARRGQGGPLKELVRANFGDMPEYPRIVLRRPPRRDLVGLTKLALEYYTAGVLRLQPEDVATLRDRLDLPAPTDGAEPPSTPEPTDATPAGPPPEPAEAESPGESVEAREAPAGSVVDGEDVLLGRSLAGMTRLRDVEGREFWGHRPIREGSAEEMIAFSSIERVHEDVRRRLGEKGLVLLQRMKRDALRYLEPLIEAGDLDRIMGLRVQELDGYDELRRLTDETYHQIVERLEGPTRREIDRIRKSPPAAKGGGRPPVVRETLAAPSALAERIAQQQADRLAMDLGEALKMDALRAVQSGRAEVVRRAAARWTPSAAALATRMSSLVTSAVALAREETALRVVNEADAPIEWCEYSAIMDGETCENCRAIDGKRVRYGSGDYAEWTPGLGWCEGKENCRCIWSYILVGEARAAEEGE